VETKPSRVDIEVTKEIKKALAVMSIALHDNLFVASASCVIYKSVGHL
jgi:DNA repair protein RadC